MKIDFHTHGKLAKCLPFSSEYTHWLFKEARLAGLDPNSMGTLRKPSRDGEIVSAAET